MDLASTFATMQAIMEITKAVVNGKIDDQIREKATELNMSIITLQSTIFELQAENQTLLNTNRDLKDKLINLSSWEDQSSRYGLHELSAGVFVYTLKKEHEETEVAHHICPNCYQQQRRSILSVHKKSLVGLHYRCPNKACGAEFTNFNGRAPKAVLQIS